MQKKDIIEYEYSLEEVALLFWSKKLFLMSVSGFFFFMSLIYSFYLPNIYTSSALLIPSQNNNGSVGSAGAYSGLAGIAGISLPSSSPSSTEEAYAKMSTYNFFKNSVLPNIYLPNLIAIDYYDNVKKQIIYDENFSEFISEEGLGVFSEEISSQLAYRMFLENNFKILKNTETGFVTLSVSHESPKVAKKWIDLIIFEINKTMRDEQKYRSTKSIEFLNKQLALANFSEIKQALASLIEKEAEKLMIIEANKDYIFRVIEPPVVEDFRSSPNRKIIILLGSFLGLIFSGLIILFKDIFSKRN